MIDFVLQYAYASKNSPDGLFADTTLVEDLFYDIIAAGTLTEDIADSLTGEDGGVQKFDVESGTWKVS